MRRVTPGHERPWRSVVWRSWQLAQRCCLARHMRSPLVRVSFVSLLALLGCVGGYASPRVASRLSPRVLAAAGGLVAAWAWWADARVLPRLYPAFHAGLFALLLAGAAVSASALVRPRLPPRRKLLLLRQLDAEPWSVHRSHRRAHRRRCLHRLRRRWRAGFGSPTTSASYWKRGPCGSVAPWSWRRS